MCFQNSPGRSSPKLLFNFLFIFNEGKNTAIGCLKGKNPAARKKEEKKTKPK